MHLSGGQLNSRSKASPLWMIPGMNLNYVPVMLILTFVPLEINSIRWRRPISDFERPGSVLEGLISLIVTALPVRTESWRT